MAVRGDDLASNIEAQIRQGVERLATEIHSSIEDVRRAVDQQLEAALHSVKADVNAVSFRSYIDAAIAEHGGAAPAAAPVSHAPAAPSGPSVDEIKRSIAAIEKGRSQVDVLNSLLEQCLRFGSRAALLILKGDVYNGWKGLGFTQSGGNDESVKRFTAPPNTIPEFDRVLRNDQVVRWNGASFAAKIGAQAPESAILVPMVIKDKVAAAMYVDRIAGDEKSFEPGVIELLVFTTGLLIDTLAIRKKIPSPSLSPIEDAGQATMIQSPPVTPPRPAAAPRPQPAPSQPPAPAPRAAEETIAVRPESFGFDAPATPSRPTAAPSFQLDDAPAMSFDASATIMTPAAPAAPPVAPAAQPPTQVRPPSTQVAPPAAKSPLAEGGDKPSTQYIPPPGLQRTGFGSQPQNEEAKKHDEARRFARLLVSEIKLYNESKVDSGRKNRDLYERMKEDIDRSRQMYDDRIPESVRLQSNYFYDELVRILADGDAEALGL